MGFRRRSAERQGLAEAVRRGNRMRPSKPGLRNMPENPGNEEKPHTAGPAQTKPIV